MLPAALREFRTNQLDDPRGLGKKVGCALNERSMGMAVPSVKDSLVEDSRFFR
jgi:hypothetical protein